MHYTDLQFGIRNTTVENVQASDGASLTEITVTWDPVTGASGYQIYFNVYGFPDPVRLLDEVSGEATTTYIHSRTNPPGNEAYPNNTYTYYVLAVYSDGSTSRLGGWDTGYLDVLP